MTACVCRQALCGQLTQRGVSVDDVDVFLESSNTPLPLSSDCFPLATSVLHVHCKIPRYNCSLVHLTILWHGGVGRYARFACLTTPSRLTLSEGVIPLDDLRDFWWVSCRMARLQYGANIYPKS